MILGLIETAMLERARLAGEAGILGYKFLTREAYPDDWEQRLISLKENFPALFVTFTSFTAVDQTRAGAKIQAAFGAVVAAQYRDNKTRARHGLTPTDPANPAVPGSLQLMEDFIGLMQGQTFGLEIGALELVAGQAPELSDEVVKAGISLMAVQFRTTFVFGIAPEGQSIDGRALGDFVTFNTQWNAPPFGDDDQPSLDLETTVTLPQES